MHEFRRRPLQLSHGAAVPRGSRTPRYKDYKYYFEFFRAVFQSSDIRRNSKIFGDNSINNWGGGDY